MLWRWIERVSVLLDGDEREVVLGDLREQGHAGISALAEVMGLVVRRQLLPWSSWRLWIALVMLFLPVSAVVSPAASVASLMTKYPWSQDQTVTTWRILNILFWGSVANVVLAWGIGFSLGWIAGRASAAAVVILSAICIWQSTHVLGSGAESVFLTLCAIVALAVIPATWGLCQGVRRNAFRWTGTLLIATSSGIAMWVLGEPLTGAALFLWPTLYAVAIPRASLVAQGFMRVARRRSA